jgi:hypothetical protein
LTYRDAEGEREGQNHRSRTNPAWPSVSSAGYSVRSTPRRSTGRRRRQSRKSGPHRRDASIRGRRGARCRRMSDPELYLDVLEEHRRSYTTASYTADYNSSVNLIRTALANGNLTLCLGAGVSIPNKVPSWLNLLDRIAARALNGADATKFSKILKAKSDLSLLTVARFLKECFSIEASFWQLYTLQLRSIGGRLPLSHGGFYVDHRQPDFSRCGSGPRMA